MPLASYGDGAAPRAPSVLLASGLKLARGFEIALDPNAPPVRERFGFTLQPSGLRVLVRAR